MAEDRNDLPEELNPEGDSGVKFTGNMPPAMRAALAKNKNKEAPEQPKQEQEAAPTKRRAGPGRAAPVDKRTGEGFKFFKSWQTRTEGSGKLEDLLEGLSERGSIYEEIELPSRGCFYDGENGPANGILHIREMTGEEEQILATPRFARKGQAINMIFQRCVKEPIKPELLLSQDRTFMLIWLRAISYTPNYEVEVRCPDTNTKFNHTINLAEDILVNYAPNDFGPEDLTGTLPVVGYNFTYRLSTGRDEVAVQDFRDWHTKKYKDQGSDDTLTFRTALLLEEIEGLSDKQELMTLIKRLPIQDVNYLRNIVTDPPFGVDTNVSIYSPYSMTEFEIDLPLEANFFFPRQTPKKDDNKPQNTPKT